MVKILNHKYVPSNRSNTPQILIYTYESDLPFSPWTDIYSLVKSETHKKVTKKYADEICSAIQGIKFKSWKELCNAIREACK